MFDNLQKELEIIYQSTMKQVKQLKDGIVSVIGRKLEEYQNELMSEIKREVSLFTEISELQDVQESYDCFKEQIINKINQLNEVELQCQNLQLNGKMSSINPLLFIRQQPTMVLNNKVTVRKPEQVQVQVRRSKSFNYQCPICQMKLTYSYAARVHLKFLHCIPKGLSCPHCDFLFTQATDLAQHIFCIHSKCLDQKTQRNYDCLFTGKQFKNRSELQLHISQEVGYLISLSRINKIPQASKNIKDQPKIV